MSRRQWTIAMAAGAGLACASAAAQTADPTIAEIRGLAADLVQGRACKWLLSFDEVALKGKITDDAARVRLQFGGRAGNTADAAARAAPKADPCNDEGDQKKQAEVALLRLEWLARADTLYITSEASTFGKAMTSLASSQAMRTVEYDRLRGVFIANSGADQWEQAYAGVTKDALTTIGLACADRVRFMTKEPRKCPVVPEATRKFIPLAIGQLKSVEAFAAAYETAAKTVAGVALARASDASRLWKATEAGSPAAALGGTSCSTGDKVVDFDGPRAQKGKNSAGKDVIVAPVIAFGNPIEVGTVTAAASGPDFILLSADEKARAAGIGSSVIFKHCAQV